MPDRFTVHICPSLALACMWEGEPPNGRLTWWRPWSNAWVPVDSPLGRPEGTWGYA